MNSLSLQTSNLPWNDNFIVLNPLVLKLCGCFMKVEDLVAKEKELQEKLIVKHTTVTDSYEKKSRGRDIENRIAPIQQRITALRQEVDDLLEIIDEI